MQLLPEKSDEDLWREAVAGESDAWGELFLRHNKAIYTFCFRRIGGGSAADDLTSAVFLEAWRLRGRARLYGDSALPWLYGIATMLTRNHQRTLRRYQGALARMAPPEPEPDPAADVAARLDAERRVERLRVALARMPQRDREVLELAAAGDLSVAEIAVALEIAPGTVKSRLSRARKRLADLMSADEDTDSSRASTREATPPIPPTPIPPIPPTQPTQPTRSAPPTPVLVPAREFAPDTAAAAHRVPRREFS